MTDGTAAVTIGLSLFFCPRQPPPWLCALLGCLGCVGSGSGGSGDESDTSQRLGSGDGSGRSDLERGGGGASEEVSGHEPLAATSEEALAAAAEAMEAAAAGGTGHILDESTVGAMPWDVVLLMGGPYV